MSAGRGLAASIPIRLKLILLVAGPLVVALGFWLGPVGPVEEVRRTRELSAAFERLLADATSITASALDTTPHAAYERPGHGTLGERLEGVGVLDAEMTFLDWAGTPVEPGAFLRTPDPPPWSIRIDGVLTRLVVLAGPDDEGRRALASFVVDGRLPDASFERLLPSELLRGVGLEIEFHDTEITTSEPEPPRREGPAGDPSRAVMLRAPGGDALATATLHPIPPDRLHARQRRAGRAWAVLLLLGLLALLVDWRERARDWRGWLVTVVVVLAGRLALLVLRVPAVLLSREMGTASFYGSSGLGRLLGSPADLLLTALAAFLLALSTRRLLAAPQGAKTVRLAATVGAALAASGLAIGLTLSVIHNAARPVLEKPAVSGWEPGSVLVLGMALALLGAGELWGLAFSLVRGQALGGRTTPRVPVAVCTIGLAVACSLLAQEQKAGLDMERLESEIAPQVLEQSARRSVALSAAVRHVNQAFQDSPQGGVPPSSRADFLAYHFWVTGDLFLGGYKSSLEFYTPNGDLLSHFGFDLPPSLDVVLPETEAPGELIIKEETFPFTDYVIKNLLHAEITVERDGEILGIVVGHILDEPENLPFLPSTQPYLSALGAGSPYHSDDPLTGNLQYALFDADGTELLSTLFQPPADIDRLRAVAADAGRVHVRAGDERYTGIALADPEGRLHLLMLPARGLLEWLGAPVRLALFSLLLLALLALVPLLLPPNGLSYLLGRLRGSFHRKLLAALLAASIIPLIGLALFLRGYIERRGEDEVIRSATRFTGAAQRQLEDYAGVNVQIGGLGSFDDPILYWVRTVLGQEIHVFEDGVLLASTKRELFTSGLLPLRLDGAVQRRLVQEERPSLVVNSRVGPREIPVAYATLRNPVPGSDFVVAVPTLIEQRQIERGVDRVVETILLVTVLLVGLLSVVAAYLARTWARPVRELVGATGRIASGDYETRLEPRTRDEVAELVHGFNSMAGALADQRADLERRREYMERLLRHATTGVISVDPEGRIVTLNPAARELLSAAGPRLRNGAELVRALSQVSRLQPLADLLSRPPTQRGDPEEVDLEIEDLPHRYRLVRVNLPDPSGGTVGSLILLDDVTEMMRSNQLAAWAEMARAIAHEIKNPLTPIQLSTEHLRRLLRDRGALPDTDVEACLETVIKQVRTLYQIAGEFSAYAKLPALAPEPVDPVAFMRTTIGPYRSAEPPGLRIVERYEPSPAVAIDTKVLSRALINLVENALHAMPDGGTLTLTAGPDPDRDQVLISVSDTGTGLDAAVRKRLFEPYFSTKSSGTGLGLAIVRRAVEAHQGTIEVDSEPGRGTTFHIRLPLAATS